MPLHLIKLAVGVDDLAEMAQFQRARTVDYGGEPAVPVHTRHKPVKEADLLEGGSLYRVIKNRIQCRQLILGLEKIEDGQDGPHCLIMVSPEIVQTVAVPKRPFQGWRYLQQKDAPPDRGLYDPAANDLVPEAMQDDLKALGLI